MMMEHVNSKKLLHAQPVRNLFIFYCIYKHLLFFVYHIEFNKLKIFFRLFLCFRFLSKNFILNNENQNWILLQFKMSFVTEGRLIKVWVGTWWKLNINATYHKLFVIKKISLLSMYPVSWILYEFNYIIWI